MTDFYQQPAPPAETEEERWARFSLARYMRDCEAYDRAMPHTMKYGEALPHLEFQPESQRFARKRREQHRREVHGIPREVVRREQQGLDRMSHEEICRMIDEEDRRAKQAYVPGSPPAKSLWEPR